MLQAYKHWRNANISGWMSERAAEVGRVGFEAQANITRGPKVMRH